MLTNFSDFLGLHVGSVQPEVHVKYSLANHSFMLWAEVLCKINYISISTENKKRVGELERRKVSTFISQPKEVKVTMYIKKENLFFRM